jgi:hypothetical protein
MSTWDSHTGGIFRSGGSGRDNRNGPEGITEMDGSPQKERWTIGRWADGSDDLFRRQGGAEIGLQLFHHVLAADKEGGTLV